MVAEVATQQTIVQPDGSVTIPEDVLDRAGIKPGHEVFFWTNGSGKVHLRLMPSLSPDDLFELYGNPDITEVDWTKVREEAEAAAAAEFVASMQRRE